MSFQDMKVLELKSVAKKTGVDVGTAKTKAEIIDVLDAEGVTFEYYQEKFVDVEKAPLPPAESIKAVAPPKTPVVEKAVVKLISGWSSLVTEWGTVSQGSPFLLIDKENVAAAVATGDFRVSSEAEVAEAYGLKG
jgi:hypothetical protein